MNERNDVTMNPEEELVDVLLDFIIVAASLAKKVSHAMKEKQIKDGGSNDGSRERFAGCNQRVTRGQLSYKQLN